MHDPKAQFPFCPECREFIKVMGVIEYVRRSTLNMTHLNTFLKSGLGPVVSKAFSLNGG